MQCSLLVDFMATPTAFRAKRRLKYCIVVNIRTVDGHRLTLLVDCRQNGTKLVVHQLLSWGRPVVVP